MYFAATLCPRYVVSRPSNSGEARNVKCAFRSDAEMESWAGRAALLIFRSVGVAMRSTTASRRLRIIAVLSNGKLCIETLKRLIKNGSESKMDTGQAEHEKLSIILSNLSNICQKT